MGVNGPDEPKDARGAVLTEGAFVCYTTNSRDSGLSFGHIKKIQTKHEQVRRYDYTTKEHKMVWRTEHKIRVNVTDAFGKPKMQTEWDPTAPNPENVDWGGNGFGDHVETDRQVVSGMIDHSEAKFLLI